MLAGTPRLPKYRHYKPKDLAVVRINGHDIYLGKYGSPESREKYRRIVAEWLTTNHPQTERIQPTEAALSVNDVILAFWTRHAEKHYRHADGTPTGELDNYRASLRPLKQLYGSTQAREFGPLKLKAVRQVMIDSNLSRNVINQRIGRIVRVFKWGVENDLVPPGVHHALQAVRGASERAVGGPGDRARRARLSGAGERDPALCRLPGLGHDSAPAPDGHAAR
jgi:hypothetical protein